MGEPDFRSRYLMKVGITKRDEDAAAPLAEGAPASELAYSDDDVDVIAHSEAQAPSRPRATDDFRLAYIQKLTASRAFIPQLSRPKSAQTVTIFDWDDTLMATTHIELVMQHFGGVPASTKEQLKALERVSIALLTLAGQLQRANMLIEHTRAINNPGQLIRKNNTPSFQMPSPAERLSDYLAIATTPLT
ncbi:hypothetical protein T492DRAFT_834631 [Pavlovales sp. CCMP2436]|nr:hypothetical protein T492DRAFT_834631 [Pavlovales sp. CCMP2436]